MLDVNCESNRMTMKNMILGLASAAAVALVALPASATVLLENSGWQPDDVILADTPSDNGPWTFSIADNATFSVVDCCVVGDVYKLFDGVTLLSTSTFYAGAGVQASGFYGTYWTDPNYSKLAFAVGPGSYTFTVTGNVAGGPASFAVRLDSNTGVPEPATWALMLVGFGGLGAGLRRARRQSAAACVGTVR